MPTNPPSGFSHGSDRERSPTKRQQQAAATREQLLQAARAVFEEKGYQAASVGAITERASTAHGTFYLYFRNKEDAFFRVVEDVFDRMYTESERPFVRDGSPEGVRRVVASYLTIYREHTGLWRSLMEAVMSNPSIEQKWLGMRRRSVRRMANGLAQLQADGRGRSLDLTLTPYVLFGMTEWFAFTHLVLEEPPPGEHAVEDAAAVIADIFVHAVFGRVEGEPG